MHLVVNHIPLTPAHEVLAKESSAMRAQRAIARLCLLWPQYEGILLACVEVVGPEVRAPSRRQPLLRRFLAAVRDATQIYIADHELRDATDDALRALCAETASLQVRTNQSEWDMANAGFRVWRQKHGGALHISTRRESAKTTTTRAQALYARLVAASGPHRRQRNGRQD